MPRRIFSFALSTASAIFAVALLVTSAQAASSEKVLYSFTGGADGSGPVAGLVFDAAGNLYGTAYSGGAKGFGTVFQLTPGSNGKWTQNVIHTFTGGNDGGLPMAGLTFDSAGNLYGTTSGNGAKGHGVVFQLKPGSNGKWTERVLHTFNFKDGGEPVGGLIFDAAGNLYGTTMKGGAHEYGTVFQLSLGSNGKWKIKVLHSFNSNGHDGYFPQAGLALDPAGNLYGTTHDGGSKNCGIVFQLVLGTNGKWTENVIHVFNAGNGHDGASSFATPAFDAAGNVYGTTNGGGASKFYGIVFQLTLDTSTGKWKESILHTFSGGSDGSEPAAGVIVDAAGNVYGTTEVGGTKGLVFQLTLGTNGKWKETVLHNFGGSDGARPMAGLVLDATGNLYGTTQQGGANNLGAVFEVTP